MEPYKSNQNSIDDVLKSVDEINDVKVSPFFKDKVMQRLYAEKETQPSIWSWFTPQLQFATLIGVIALNVIALTQLDSTTNSSDLDTFSQTFELSITDESSIFN